MANIFLFSKTPADWQGVLGGIHTITVANRYTSATLASLTSEWGAGHDLVIFDIVYDASFAARNFAQQLYLSGIPVLFAAGYSNSVANLKGGEFAEALGMQAKTVMGFAGLQDNLVFINGHPSSGALSGSTAIGNPFGLVPLATPTAGTVTSTWTYGSTTWKASYAVDRGETLLDGSEAPARFGAWPTNANTLTAAAAQWLKDFVTWLVALPLPPGAGAPSAPTRKPKRIVHVKSGFTGEATPIWPSEYVQVGPSLNSQGSTFRTELAALDLDSFDVMVLGGYSGSTIGVDPATWDELWDIYSAGIPLVVIPQNAAGGSQTTSVMGFAESSAPGAAGEGYSDTLLIRNHASVPPLWRGRRLYFGGDWYLPAKVVDPIAGVQTAQWEGGLTESIAWNAVIAIEAGDPLLATAEVHDGAPAPARVVIVGFNGVSTLTVADWWDTPRGWLFIAALEWLTVPPDPTGARFRGWGIPI